MDWRSNQWVGIGAAVLLVVGVVVVFLWVGRGPAGPGTVLQGKGNTFQCESTGKTFRVAQKEFDKVDVYSEYMDKYGQPVLCRLDGKKDAYQVYYCPDEKKYFRYQPGDEMKDVLRCPNGHKINDADM